MGLQITKTSGRFGMDLLYWKVGQVRINWHNRKCHAQLLGFVNQTQRNDGKEPVKVVDFHFNDVDFAFDHISGIVEQVYAKIKADEDWSSATDVLE